MLTTPNSAPVGSPAALLSGGSAWNARYRYEEPSIRTRRCGVSDMGGFYRRILSRTPTVLPTGARHAHHNDPPPPPPVHPFQHRCRPRAPPRRPTTGPADAGVRRG